MKKVPGRDALGRNQSVGDLGLGIRRKAGSGNPHSYIPACQHFEVDVLSKTSLYQYFAGRGTEGIFDMMCRVSWQALRVCAFKHQMGKPILHCWDVCPERPAVRGLGQIID